MDVRPSKPFCTDFSRLIRNGKHRFPPAPTPAYRDGVADLRYFAALVPINSQSSGNCWIRAYSRMLKGRSWVGWHIMVAFCTGEVTNVGDGWLIRQPPVKSDLPAARTISAAHCLFPHIFREVAPIPTFRDKAEVCKAVFAECGTFSAVIFQIADRIV